LAKSAEYREVYSGSTEWNPSDYAFHLSRRARGVPFWFNLASFGIEGTRDCIRQSLLVSQEGAALLKTYEYLELVAKPALSVMLFRRIGWSSAEYESFSDLLLQKGVGFVVTTKWRDETVLRFCLVNPETTVDDYKLIFDMMA
jgi:glutamate/tyrosine decarboxylase-like PLP-dependent enzyme